jgi:hypothetical protein
VVSMSTGSRGETAARNDRINDATRAAGITMPLAAFGFVHKFYRQFRHGLSYVLREILDRGHAVGPPPPAENVGSWMVCWTNVVANY